MSHAKQASKRKRGTQVVPLLGAAGLSLSLASGASALSGPAAERPAHNIGVSNETVLSEEEICDVSLATFYIFDQENGRRVSPRGRLAGGCGCGCTCAGPGCGGCAGGLDTEGPTYDSAVNPPNPMRESGHRYRRAPKHPRLPNNG